MWVRLLSGPRIAQVFRGGGKGGIGAQCISSLGAVRGKDFRPGRRVNTVFHGGSEATVGLEDSLRALANYPDVRPEHLTYVDESTIRFCNYSQLSAASHTHLARMPNGTDGTGGFQSLRVSLLASARPLGPGHYPA